MADFQINPDEVDFDALPPLVPKGENREEVLDALTAAWCIPITGNPKPNEVGGVTLDRVALVDANTDEPIDLGDLLRRVAQRLSDSRDLSAEIIVRGVRVVLRACRIDKCDAKGLDLPFEFHAQACRFRGNARFDGVRFGKYARFDGASFGGYARFDGASFGRHAGFGGASFGKYVRFDGASFGRNAWFDGASFGRHTGFDGASFGRNAQFNGASFGGHAGFGWASFGGYARFNGASFGGGAWFSGAGFGGKAEFSEASFGGPFNAVDATFVEGPQFVRSRFSDEPFNATKSCRSVLFQDGSRDLATFGRSRPAGGLGGWLLLRGFDRLGWRIWTIGHSKLHWGLVRVFGETAVLTRVSTAALLIVPILAAVWPAVQSGIQNYANHSQKDWQLPEHMPWVWGALFFAALFVVFGRAIYQAFSPQLVREYSRFDLIKHEMEEFRKTRKTEGDRRLQEAINWIERAGTDPRLCWSRNPNLVSHNGRTVWIPSKLDDFDDEPEWVDASIWKAGFKANPSDDANATTEETEKPDKPKADDAANEGNKANEDRDAHKKIKTAEPVMARSSRKDIAIESGADARYDVDARQNLTWARAALWCYALAFVLVFLVLWTQSMAVLLEIGLDGRTFDIVFALQWAPWAVCALIAILVIADAFLRRPLYFLARPFNRLFKWAKSKSKRHDEFEAELQRRLKKHDQKKS